MHDAAHGIVDNRRFEVLAAIIALLKDSAASNATADASTSAGTGAATTGARVTQQSVRTLLPLATRHMVVRYNAFNDVLKSYVRSKKAAFLSSNRDKPARLEYNRGVTALFTVLHEFYGFRAGILAQPTLETAIARLCRSDESRQTLDDRSPQMFDELSTLFDPSSDSSNAQIIAQINRRPLASVQILPAARADGTVPSTIGDYYDQLGSWNVSRGRVYTKVSFEETTTGKCVTLHIPTTRYLLDTAKDANNVLELAGQSVLPLSDDYTDLASLEVNAPARTDALEKARAWLSEVDTRSNALVAGLPADLFRQSDAGLTASIADYDALVARQNTE